MKKTKDPDGLTPKERKFVESIKEQFIAKLKDIQSATVEKVQVLPIEIQCGILNDTAGFLTDVRPGRHGFKEQIANKENYPTRGLLSMLRELRKFRSQLEDTLDAVDAASEILLVEKDSRQIGKEPSDSVLARDERTRLSRHERYLQRHQKGK